MSGADRDGSVADRVSPESRRPCSPGRLGGFAQRGVRERHPPARLRRHRFDQDVRTGHRPLERAPSSSGRSRPGRPRPRSPSPCRPPPSAPAPTARRLPGRAGPATADAAPPGPRPPPGRSAPVRAPRGRSGRRGSRRPRRRSSSWGGMPPARPGTRRPAESPGPRRRRETELNAPRGRCVRTTVRAPRPHPRHPPLHATPSRASHPGRGSSSGRQRARQRHGAPPLWAECLRILRQTVPTHGVDRVREVEREGPGAMGAGGCHEGCPTRLVRVPWLPGKAHCCARKHGWCTGLSNAPPSRRDGRISAIGAVSAPSGTGQPPPRGDRVPGGRGVSAVQPGRPRRVAPLPRRRPPELSAGRIISPDQCGSGRSRGRYDGAPPRRGRGTLGALADVPTATFSFVPGLRMRRRGTRGPMYRPQPSASEGSAGMAGR